MISGEVSQADQKSDQTIIDQTATTSNDQVATVVMPTSSNDQAATVVMPQADQNDVAAMPQSDQTVADQVATAMSPVDQVVTTPSMDHVILTDTYEPHQSSDSETEQFESYSEHHSEEHDSPKEDHSINNDEQNVENSRNNQLVGESVTVHDPQGIQLQVDLSKLFLTNQNDSVVPSSRVSRDTEQEEAAGSHHMVTRKKSNKLLITHVSLTAEGSNVEPKTISQALATPHWVESASFTSNRS
ncbi:hypothetical protein HAX54_048220 [Datura stramonium]|uniref:Uncharacterized protein n=1 Tax=Datura stramonium TaxID=4076 RepID=A0ABS8STM2_DATST|nr:hypothetical protein [Datura stramonium]